MAQSVKHLPWGQVITQGPEIEPHIGLPVQQGACFSPFSGLILSLTISFSQINNNIVFLKNLIASVCVWLFTNKCILS